LLKIYRTSYFKADFIQHGVCVLYKNVKYNVRLSLSHSSKARFYSIYNSVHNLYDVYQISFLKQKIPHLNIYYQNIFQRRGVVFR